MENKIIKGDCLEVMKDIPDKSVDMILCDLPYGITQNKWDSVIELDKMWKEYSRIIKENGAIVLTSSQPFTSKLIMSNPKLFKYCLVWEKDKAGNILNSNRQVLKIHEDICIFYKGQCVYNPQKELLEKPYKHKNRNVKSKNFGSNSLNYNENGYTEYTHSFPKSIIRFSKEKGGIGSLHPTQKPVALFEYLIKTYTNEGDLVLDNCAGSGTTGVACKNLNRNFILIEKEEKYIKVIEERLGQQSATDFTQNSTSSGFPTENSPNISLKDNSNELSQISSNDETSLNNNIKLNRGGKGEL